MLWDRGLSHIAASTRCARRTRWHPVSSVAPAFGWRLICFPSLLWYISLQLNNQVYGLTCLGRISTWYQACLIKNQNNLFYLSCVKLLRLIHNSAKWWQMFAQPTAGMHPNKPFLRKESMSLNVKPWKCHITEVPDWQSQFYSSPAGLLTKCLHTMKPGPPCNFYMIY